MRFKYIIAGDGNMAIVAHSSLNLFEFRDLIKSNTHKIHPKGRDTFWRIGACELINPRVFTVSDFADWCPLLIHLDS